MALTRHTGVDLWRLYTGQTTLAKLGLVAQRGRDYVVKTPWANTGPAAVRPMAD